MEDEQLTYLTQALDVLSEAATTLASDDPAPGGPLAEWLRARNARFSNRLDRAYEAGADIAEDARKWGMQPCPRYYVVPHTEAAFLASKALLVEAPDPNMQLFWVQPPPGLPAGCEDRGATVTRDATGGIIDAVVPWHEFQAGKVNLLTFRLPELEHMLRRVIDERKVALYGSVIADTEPADAAASEGLTPGERAVAYYMRHRTTVTDVCRAVGISRSTFYRSDDFREVRAAMELDKRSRASYRRGSKNPRTGGMEAWEADK